MCSSSSMPASPATATVERQEGTAAIGWVRVEAIGLVRLLVKCAALIIMPICHIIASKTR